MIASVPDLCILFTFFSNLLLFVCVDLIYVSFIHLTLGVKF